MSLTVALALAGGAVALQGCVAWNAERKAPPIGRFVDVAGERLHILELGAEQARKGPPIVLIHGASVNLRDMKIALGERLAAERRVIIIDRPGRGYSTRPRGGHALESQAGLIREALRALDVDNPVIVGQSLGGAVALAYTLQYQSEMSGVVLLAPVSHPFEGGVAWYNHVSQWPIAGLVFRRGVLPLYAPLVARKSVEKSFAPDTAPEGYYDNAGVTLLFRAKDFKSNAADLTNLNRRLIEQSPSYPGIRTPMVIFSGDADRTVSPKIHAERLAREVPGATLTLLPDTGHALHHAESETIARAILAVGAP
jgi:pimeloyl-ACP methyl ester carboxylesterase